MVVEFIHSFIHSFMDKHMKPLAQASHADINISKSFPSQSCYTKSRVNLFVNVILNVDCKHMPSIAQKALGPAPPWFLIRAPLPMGPPSAAENLSGAQYEGTWHMALGIWVPHKWPSHAGGESSQYQQLVRIKYM